MKVGADLLQEGGADAFTNLKLLTGCDTILLQGETRGAILGHLFSEWIHPNNKRMKIDLFEGHKHASDAVVMCAHFIF